MKRIDVQNEITKYLSTNNLYLVDSLSKHYTIKTYEEYINCFSLINSTYSNNIIEFAEEGKKYIDKINNFITKVIEVCNEDTIEQHIKNNMPSEIGYSQYNLNIQLISIHPDSFLMQRECSQEAFVNIYKELGYDRLKDYIQLVKTPSNFSSYINDTNKQIVAMKFLLYKTDHHSPNRLTRDHSAETIYKMNSNHIKESLSEITKEKDDYISYMNTQKEDFKNYMDTQKQDYNKWFSDTSNQINDFREEHSKKLVDIEKTYEAKLKIEEPAKFMLEQSEKYKKSFYLWCCAIVGLTILLIGLLALIVSPQVSFNDKLIIINVLSKDMPVYSSIILLAMISLVVYVLRIFIKMAVSSKHLMEEYKQKYSLTYFYLSLVNNDNIEDEKSQNIILTSLFTKADTGLIKNDGSNEMDKTLLSLLTK